MKKLVTKRELKGLAIATVAGGAGVAAMSEIVQRIPAGTTRPRVWRGLMLIGGGAVVGLGLGKLDPDAGIGFAGGVCGYGVASLLLGLFKDDAGMPRQVNLGGRRTLTGLRGGRAGRLAAAEIYEGKPGQPRLAGSQGVGGVVVTQRRPVPIAALGG